MDRAGRWAGAGLVAEASIPPALPFGQQTLLRTYQGGEVHLAPWQTIFLHQRKCLVERLNQVPLSAQFAY